jgi:tetratricopeptide (TPR) repeat protein
MQGLSGVAPAEFADGWGDLVKNHPAFSAKPSSTAVVSAPAAAQDPDPALAERYFAAGLSLYYARNFDAAEADFQTAVQNHGEDARFLYFRGLARLPLGKIEAAQDDFRKAVALERRGLPDSATIGMYFERIQGDERRLINQFRK